MQCRVVYSLHEAGLAGAVRCTSNSSNVTTTYYHATCTTYHDVCQSVAEFFSLVHSNLHCHFTRTYFSVEDFQNQPIVGVFTVRISSRCEYYKIIMRASKIKLHKAFILRRQVLYEPNNALHTWLPAWKITPISEQYCRNAVTKEIKAVEGQWWTQSLINERRLLFPTTDPFIHTKLINLA